MNPLILEWRLLIWVVLHALLQVSLRGREESEAMSDHNFFVELRSVVRGYHVYKRDWTPILGEHAPYMRIAAIYTNGSAFGGSTPPIY